MIPEPVLTQWRQRAPWGDDRQVAQDLLLSLLAIRVAQHPRLSDALAWRGGTALHKLHLETARRYSEDLDYVLVSAVSHTTVVRSLKGVAEDLGMECIRDEVSDTRVDVWASVEVPAAGGEVRIKFEVNCADADPCMELLRVEHDVRTRAWDAAAEIVTYQPPELVGTKFRALAQRRKGRDLWDLWLARRELSIEDEILARGADHCLAHEDITPTELRRRVAAHRRDPDFGQDVAPLTGGVEVGFDVDRLVHALIQWTDQHLDPLYYRRLSDNARRRDRQRWAKEGGWAPGKVRCPRYERVSGNLSRCVHWYDPGDACPDHGDGRAS